MSKQKKRNIRLLILCGFLLTMVAVMSLRTTTSDSLDINRKMFAIENTLDINKVEVSSQGNNHLLEFRGGKWILDNEFEADPTKIHLLFATIQQVSVRRPVGNNQSDSLRSVMTEKGSSIRFYIDDTEVTSINSLGDSRTNTTYFSGNNGNLYLMEIPGYRAYIHPLLDVNSFEWRNKNLFHKLNWRNLAGLNISFPELKDGFEIVSENNQFKVKGIAQADTTRLFDYIDYISLLETDRYLDESEINLSSSPNVKIDVRDVGNRPYVLEIYNQYTSDSLRIGRIDSTFFFGLEKEKALPLLTRKEYFVN